MEHESGSSSLHTRSKAAPDWTVEESLILVNEVTAIEADCGGTLSSFQKWKIIVENCNALDVNRNLNQCRRKWDSLLSDYKKIKQSGSKKASFNSDLFKGIERYVREYASGYDTDLESDPDEFPEPPIAAAVVQSDSKNQRAKVVIASQKQTIEEKAKPTRLVKSENNEVEGCSSEPLFVEINREEHEQDMADKLKENARLIEAIVKQQSSKDLGNDLTRINGEKIINCLSNLAVTLDELSKLQTDSVV